MPSGADKNEVAREALRQQGARPWDRDDFSTTGLVWDQFSDADTGNDFVTQNYNPNNDPTGGAGESALLSTQSRWGAPTYSTFTFFYGGTTDRCPSLVRECEGKQEFDGNNDVAWLELRGCCTLGVTWFGTSTDEADVALNTKFSWSTDGVNDFDVETVFLHENGHVVGLGHSDVLEAVMYASYQGVRHYLHQDDIDGITSLYPAGPTNEAPTVGITSPADGATFDSGTLIGFAGSASDTEDGDLTANLAWTSDIDGPIGTGGSFSAVLSDGDHVITASVTDSGSASGSDSVTITVGTPNSPPTVTITSPTDGSTFDSGTTILFEGTASDSEDGGLTSSLVWNSDLDGQIGTGGSFSATLSDGTHTITASVTDSDGATSSSSITVTVGNPPTEPTTVSVDSITYATKGGKNSDKHLLITVSLVDDLGNSVSGASVSIRLNNADTGQSWIGTATTGTDGTVTFSLSNAPKGTYTTTVTDVVATGLTWDGNTPPNSFEK